MAYHLDLDESEWLDDEPTYPAAVRPRARVLLVTDEARMRTRLGARLRGDGYDLFEASSSDEAIGLLATIFDDGWPTDAVELVVVDLAGAAALAVVRALRARRSVIPAVLVTRSHEPAVRDSAAGLGARLLPRAEAVERISAEAIDSILARGTAA